jgi:hypothetical protein
MTNNRDLQREDMDIVAKDWWVPIILTSPDKDVYSNKVGTTEPLLGDVRKDPKVTELDEGGAPVSTEVLSIVIKTTDMERVPLEGESWFIEYPEDLTDAGTMKKAAFTPNNSLGGSVSLGYLKVFPQAI